MADASPASESAVAADGPSPSRHAADPVERRPGVVGWLSGVWEDLRVPLERPAAPWRPYFDLSRRIGGGLGRHSVPRAALHPAPWIIVFAVIAWIILMMRQLPCRQSSPDDAVDSYGALCYSDIPLLYNSRGISQGQAFYTDVPWEYPVLSGFFANVARWITDHLGFRAAPGLSAETLLANTHVYFAVTAVMLFICFLVVVIAQIALVRRDSWMPIAVAASPAIMTAGLINWDLFVVALTSLGLLAWVKRHPVWAGALLGLAAAAKFYPLFVIGALFLWCWRAGRLPEWVRATVAALIAWFAVNLPLAIIDFSAWSYFYTYNADRGAEFGSIWYALQLMGWGLPGVKWWSRAVIVAGLAGLAFLVWKAPIRPRLIQVVYLAVAVFVVGNVVYSPQYVLWLVPLVTLARPILADLAVFTVGELVYFVAIWAYLDAKLTPPDGGPPWLYIAAVVVRVAATCWIMSRVVRDVWHPEKGPFAARVVPAVPATEPSEPVASRSRRRRSPSTDTVAAEPAHRSA
ncbi:MAG: glycosyltransferase 87 family protein [Propionibacteriaceae bacterium]|jgi:uncharacterized membrane protein|nr:glycosyltransferase 87 family protein [Propionibacteriaceae bacterium]